ncbi:hypothetical protein KUV26_05345 [Leisingera daeponensis]|uniref:Uncharacterized protein n=1 Tax=Leisingera daeponensis TaxID=405746 RepID=A0ABS7NCD2_9RHOB|nr:hypothetical protein [Leisingera daeponensis]MBY6138857.1 hypothetical protein [Leisingera daeponensis]
MANTPDPLANNPAIRQWAERFYAVKAWSMPDMPEAGDAALDLRRAAALEELSKISVPAALSSGARRSLAGGRKALKKEILSAAAAEAFEQIDGEIRDLKDQIAAQLAIAAARGEAQAALAAAEEKFAEERGSLDQGAFTYLEALIKAAQQAMAAAVSDGDFGAVETQAKAISVKAEGAKAYGVFFDNWTRATLVLIKRMEDPAKEAAATARAAQMAAAAALSKAGDFDGAKAALEAWKSSLDTEDHLAAAVSFDNLLCGYEANHHKRCQNILSSQLRDARDFRDHLKDAKKLAYTDSKFPEAEAKLNALIAYGTKERAALAKFLRGFDMSMMSNADFRTAVLAAQTKQAAAGDNDPKRALRDLKSWVKAHPAIMGQSYSTQILKALQKRYDALKQVLKEPELSDLNATWDAHRLLAEAGNFDMDTGAPQHHAKLDLLFKLEAITDSRREMDAILRKHPAAAGYDFHKPVADALAAANYPQAVAAAPAALALLQAVPEYLALRQAAQDLLAALPGDPADLRSTLDGAIQAAELTARGGDPVKATADLRAVLDGTDYLNLMLEMTDYRAKLAKVGKEHARAKKYLKLPEAEAALDASLKTATDRADNDREYGDAFLMLDTHQRLLAEAKPMATARYQVQGIIKALKRAGTGPDKLVPFEDRVSAAESEARKPDFAKARTDFDSIRTDLGALCASAALDCEAADGAGSNAGHSLDRHGPDVSDEDLITRLKTGKPPNAHSDDERSYTGASSKFHSPQDWLAGRELAAQAALAKGIDITETEMTFTGDPLADPEENADFTVEHGRPIDKAYIGHKKHVRLDDSGEPIPDKTYETFEEIEGLTRAYVNFIWEPELLPAETTNHPAPNTHHDEEKAQDNADYVAKYTARHGAAPAKIPGRWVMMQQYPVADGWDNETKTYTNGNPGNMIP